MKFDIKIELDKVILIGEYPNYSANTYSSITTRWLQIKGIEDKIFKLKSYADGELLRKFQEENYEIIDVEKRLKEKISKIISRELKEIYKENINNDFLLEYKASEFNPYLKIYPILENGYSFGKNIRDDEYRIKYLNLEFQQINNGIITVMNNDIKYDLINDRFLNSDREILSGVYRENEVKQIILYQKYVNGLGTGIYNEIAKINNFLNDKKSVNVILKNGIIFKAEAKIRNILNICANGKIYVSDVYTNKIIKGKRFESQEYKANEIEYLKYGNDELKINTDNLMMLDEDYLKEIEDTEEEEEI